MRPGDKIKGQPLSYISRLINIILSSYLFILSNESVINNPAVQLTGVPLLKKEKKGKRYKYYNIKEA